MLIIFLLMANAIFKCGVMSAGKSNDLIQQWYNFEQNGIPSLIIKGDLDRDGTPTIKSRTGLVAPAVIIPEFKLFDFAQTELINNAVFFIDEAQFRKPEEIDDFVKLADDFGKQIFFYGLLTDVNEQLFPGSKRILEKGCRMETLKTCCQSQWHCRNLATHHLRFTADGRVIKNGSSVVVDNSSEIFYKSVCRQCYNRYLKD